MRRQEISITGPMLIPNERIIVPVRDSILGRDEFQCNLYNATYAHLIYQNIVCDLGHLSDPS
jgi:hypothetical protein